MTVRWITPEIATGAYDKVPAAPEYIKFDVRDMVDRSGNSVEALRARITAALALLKLNEKLVICCDHGISRSNAVAAAVISVRENVMLEVALSRVLQATGNPEIRLELLTAVRAALQGFSSSKNVETETDTVTSAQSGRRLMVTGGAGYLGTAIVNAGIPDTYLFYPTRQELDLQEGSAKIDLYLRKNKITQVLHLAHPRIVNTNGSVGNALTMLRNVLDACNANALPLAYASSWHIFSGYREQDLSVDEHCTVRPSGCLGDAKFLCEALLEQYALRHHLPVTIIRSGPIFGGGSVPHFLRTMCRRAMLDETITTHQYSNGLPALDLLHLEDYLSALRHILQADEKGIFHVGSGQTMTTQRMAQIIVAALNSASKLGHEAIDDKVGNIRMDYAKLQKRFGWQPAREPAFELAQFAKKFVQDMGE